MPLASNPLIQVTPGLMIWTIVCFLITLYVLKRFAFGPIQKLIDERRERIRRALDEADEARQEARKLLEEHRKLIGQARGEAEEIRSVARHEGEAQLRRVKDPIVCNAATISAPSGGAVQSTRCARSASAFTAGLLTCGGVSTTTRS